MYIGLVNNQPDLDVAVGIHANMKLKYFCDERSEHQDWTPSVGSNCTMMWDTEDHHLPASCDLFSSPSTTIGLYFNVSSNRAFNLTIQAKPGMIDYGNCGYGTNALVFISIRGSQCYRVHPLMGEEIELTPMVPASLDGYHHAIHSADVMRR